MLVYTASVKAEKHFIMFSVLPVRDCSLHQDMWAERHNFTWEAVVKVGASVISLAQEYHSKLYFSVILFDK